MKIHCKIIIISLISLIFNMSLTGCSRFLSSRMPTGSVSMEQAYNNAINGSDDKTNSGSLNQVRAKVNILRQHTHGYSGYTQTQENAINLQFSQLPNPSIVMYVYPHEAGSGYNITPVPGYSTVFPLYQHMFYAMPFER